MEKLRSIKSAMDSEKERYRKMTGRTIWKRRQRQNRFKNQNSYKISAFSEHGDRITYGNILNRPSMFCFPSVDYTAASILLSFF